MPSGDNLRAEQQRIRRRAQALEKAAAHATSLGCPSACSPLDYDGMTIKPPGRTPRNHYWDPWTAVYRRKETHALHDLPVEHRAQVRASHARVLHAQRLRGHNPARRASRTASCTWPRHASATQTTFALRCCPTR